MHGPDYTRPDPIKLEILSRASTATLTTIFSRQGIRNLWMPLKPLFAFAGCKTVGPALTIRTVPGRDDLQPISRLPGTLFEHHPDRAIDAVKPGDVVVVDGGGVTHEGLFGDLLTLRIKTAGANGLVCDMAVRDGPHMTEIDLPIFCRGTAAPGATVFNVDYNVPIGCAGVCVCPGDVIVGDDDCVVVVPQALLDEAVANVLKFEAREEFIRLRLAEGHSQRGPYPMGPKWDLKFETWWAERQKQSAG